MEEIHKKVLLWTYETMCQVITQSNKNINYKILDEYIFEHYDCMKRSSIEAVLIYESYTFLEKIEFAGITENNYNSKEEVLKNSLLKVNELCGTNMNITMLPKPSRIIYILKYFLLNVCELDKDLVKPLLDVVNKKVDVAHSRMPKQNLELDYHIQLREDIKTEKFNSTEGKSKWQFFGISLFDLPEFKEFRNLIYKEQPDLIEQKLKTLTK